MIITHMLLTLFYILYYYIEQIGIDYILRLTQEL